MERSTEGGADSGHFVFSFTNNYPPGGHTGLIVLCRWNITQDTNATKPHWLHLQTVVLDAHDQVTVKGFVLGDSTTSPNYGYEGLDQTVLEETLLYDSSNGPPGSLLARPGLIHLTGYRYVEVTMVLSAFPRDPVNCFQRRAFTAVYYWNCPVELSQRAGNGSKEKVVEGGGTAVGQLTFPIDNLNRPEVLNGTLELAVPKKLQNDHLILLNFTALPENVTRHGKVSLDGGALLPRPNSQRMYLQTAEKTKFSISFHSLLKTEQITLRYWIVSKNCSKAVLLKVGQPAQEILVFPNQNPLSKTSAAVRCATFYQSTSGPEGRLLLHMPRPTSLANMADLLYVYDSCGQAVVGLSSFVADSFSAKDTIIKTSTAAVLYESPYFSPPNVHFQVPQIKAIPPSQEKN